MDITVLCSSVSHPVNPYIARWAATHGTKHTIRFARKGDELVGGDLLFLVSCTELLKPEVTERFRKTLVLHASDLPRGRGWSPHIWEIIGGAESLTVSLLEAAERVDAGPIWKKSHVRVPRDALSSEINHLIFTVEMELMSYAVDSFHIIEPIPQPSEGATYYRRRTPEDSRIDPERSIASQFDLIRVCDPDRFPAFFELRGNRYIIRLEKVRED